MLEEGEEVSLPVRPLLEEPEELPEPDVPDVPEVPDVPDEPEELPEPEVPEVPDEPDEPDEPEEPEEPSPEPEEPDEEPPEEPLRPPPPLRFSSEMMAGVNESEESRISSGSAFSIRLTACVARSDINAATSPFESSKGAAPESEGHVMSARGAKNEDSFIAVWYCLF